MIETIGQMYITLMPIILAGIFNMIWCKTSYFAFLEVPLDQNKTLKDGRRLFGNNKTWKGLLGYLFFGAVSGILWGLICHWLPILADRNFLYVAYENTLRYNGVMGALFGLAYALCELPNSFIKRRSGIIPGKLATSKVRILFFVLDQIDSLIGCVLVLAIVYPMSLGLYVAFIFLGGLTHIGVNLLLYGLKIRKNVF